MTHTERLLEVVDVFCRAKGMTAEQVSYRVFRDQRRIPRVSAGQVSLTVRSLDAALDWLSENWPDGVEWPDALPRPVVQEAAE